MTEFRGLRVLVILAGIMGAAGVILAAVSAHQADTTRLAAASSMLLFHTAAVLGAAALVQCGVIHARIGIVAVWGFVIAAALFATDLTLRQYFSRGLFSFAAPTGGMLLIVSWLVLAIAAVWSRRD